MDEMLTTLIEARARIANREHWFGAGNPTFANSCYDPFDQRHCAHTALKQLGIGPADTLLSEAALDLFPDYVCHGPNGGMAFWPAGTPITEAGGCAHIMVNNYIGHEAVLRVYDLAIQRRMDEMCITLAREENLAVAGD